MKAIGLGFLGLASLVFVGCSNDAPAISASTGVSLDQLQVGRRDQLPVCDDSTEATLAFLADEKKLVVCLSGAWQEVALPSGAPGAQGEKGDKGDKGDTGEQGFVGRKGDKGDKGDTGLQGLQGIRGYAGEKGDPGEPGQAGHHGKTGASGYTSLVKVSKEKIGSKDCEFGGVRIDVGVDTDRSSVLDESEITGTSFVCNSSLPVRKRTVFVTSDLFSGDLGGLAGADAKCATAAARNTELSGKSFKAWLAVEGASASSRFANDGKFYLTNGLVFAENFSMMSSSYIGMGGGASPFIPLNADEMGATLTDMRLVWTGTGYVIMPGMETTGTCNDWTSTALSTSVYVGLGLSYTAWSWAYGTTTADCGEEHPIYCIEE